MTFVNENKDKDKKEKEPPAANFSRKSLTKLLDRQAICHGKWCVSKRCRVLQAKGYVSVQILHILRRLYTMAKGKRVFGFASCLGCVQGGIRHGFCFMHPECGREAFTTLRRYNVNIE